MDENSSNDTLTFLGTGGARFIMTSQLLATGGIWMNLSGTQILLDPGPGSIVHSTKRKLDADKLSAIIVSHRHLDHSGDVNIMVEAMTQGRTRKHGWLFAPSDALEPESVLLSYLKGSLEGIEVLQEGKSYQVDNISFTTPVRHIHQVETYGMVFKTPGHTFSYIADTRYFDGLIDAYKAELLIMNVAFLESRPAAGPWSLPTDHLAIPDAAHIISEIKPKTAIMTHFGMNVWRAHPWQLAEILTEQTGVKVIAARDGMKFDMAQVDGVK